jgi:hypothetical protein
MADAAPSEPRPARLSVVGTWRRLNFEQRVAAVGAGLLIVSTLGPFTFVEAAIVLVGAGVLFLLRKRAEGREFHIPFGDGAVIAAAGGWAGLLIVVRLFSRPLGQGLLALVCAAILILAGLRERAKRPMDDLPTARVPDEPPPLVPRAPAGGADWMADDPAPVPGAPRTEPAVDRAAYRDETLPLPEPSDPPQPPASLRPAKVLPPKGPPGVPEAPKRPDSPPPRPEEREQPPLFDDDRPE